MFSVIRNDQVPESVENLPTSQALRAGDFVFLSAQCSSDAEGKSVEDTLEGEVRRTFDNMRKVLSGAGLDLSDVVQIRTFLRDREDVPEFNRIYSEIFKKPYPVRTTLTGCLPYDRKIAADAIAYAGRDSDG